MDVNDIVNALEGILGLGDTLDSNGIGINTATGGEHTTREVLKTELGQFLMYVGAGGSSFSDGQVGLVNLLLSDQFGQIPAWRMKSVADDMTPPDPARNLSFIAFSAGDKAIAQQEGTPSKQLTDALINLYETFGMLMVAFNENAVSQSRCDSYVRSMRSMQSAGGLAAKTEPAKPAKPAAPKRTASKSTAAKSSGKPKNSTKKAASKGSLAQFNDHISFALSGDYRMTWEKDNDGNDQCRIVSTKLSDSDNETPETTFVVSTPENENPDRDVFEFVQEGDDKSTFIPFNSDPEALMAITNLDMQVLSMNFRTSIYRLLIRLSKTEILQLFYTSTSSEGQNKMGDDIKMIIDLWRCLRIDGEAVDLGEADSAQSLADYLMELQNNGGKPKKKDAASSKSSSSGSKAKKKKQEMIIRTKPAAFSDAEQYRGIHEVEGEPERVNPLGIWSIQVPPGCSYTMDPDYTAGSFAGKYPLQIQSTEDRNFDNAYDSRFNLAVFAIGAKNDAYSALTDLSSDEATEAIVRLAAIADREYAFFKHTGGIAIMTKDVTEKQKEYGAMFLIFTRGMQYVTNGQIVVRGKSKKAAKEEAEKILGSILPVEQPTGEAEYKPVVLPERYGLTYHDHKTIKLDGSITLPVPDGFKASTDQKKIGAPRKFSIVPNDYSDFSKAMDAMIGITAVTLQGEFPEYTPEICDEVVRQIKEQLEQHDVFVAEIPLVIAQKTTKGFICYQKAFGKDTNKYITAKAIMLVGDAAYVISFALNFEDKIANRYDVGIDAQMIISDWLNRIVLPGEKQYCISSGTEAPEDPEEPEWISNLISFPPPETLHEHFDLITGGGYTTHRDADFIGQSIRGLMEKCGSTDEEAYDDMQISVDKYDLDVTAIELAKVFRVDESKFDPYNDAEGLIRLGAFSHVRMFHALRSLSWMISRYTDWEDRSVKDISFEDLQAMGKLITKRNYLNYDGQTGYINLCNHYDWHVFYVPEKYIKSKYARNNDLRYLTGKENRGGNTTTFFMPGMGADQLRAMNRKNEIIGRNEETLESLEGLRKDLRALLPIMQTIHDGLLEDRDRSEELEGPLADALTAWCALAVAAKEPFYSEEATDTPEADAGLDGPLERPTDKLENKPVGKGKGTKRTTDTKAARPAARTASPVGDDLGLNGATVIEPGQFIANMTLRNIVIPEGVTEIGDRAFSSCMNLETVVFPKSLRKIGEFAFMSCRALRKVELQEGVEEMGTHAFGATNSLTQVHLPDSLKKVDRCVFGLGGDSPYATAYLSGKLAKQLYEVNGDEFNDIYARHIIIDGKPYESVKAYLYTIGIHANGYYPPYDPEAAAREAEERRKNYRADMEAACREGKPLQEMIETARGKVNADAFADKDAFEQAIRNLDRDASVTFAGKHFVLTGFGNYEDDVKAEIEKRGGIVHSSMVKMADYLVVRLESPGAGKTKKALEWRQKGANNLIISDYQMWQAMLKGTGTTKSSQAADKPSVKTAAPKKAAPTASSKPAAKPAAKPKPTPAAKPAAKQTISAGPKPGGDKDGFRVLDLKGASVIREKQFFNSIHDRKIEIPEGVTEIENCAMSFGEMETVKLPRSLRKIGQQAFGNCSELKEVIFQEGLREIVNIAFIGCLKLDEVRLPDSLQKVGYNAFVDEIVNHSAHVIVHVSGDTAKRLFDSKPWPSVDTIEAGGFVIDGQRYRRIEDYIPVWEKAQAARQAEIQSKRRKEQIRAQISRLEKERDSLRGLFAGFKKKKLQREIDELKDQERNI